MVRCEDDLGINGINTSIHGEPGTVQNNPWVVTALELCEGDAVILGPEGQRNPRLK